MTCKLYCPECDTVLVKQRKRRKDRKDAGTGTDGPEQWFCQPADGGCGAIVELVARYPTRPS